MMNQFKKTIFLSATVIAVLAGCQPNDPSLTTAPPAVKAIPPEKPTQAFDRHYDFARSEATVEQAKYDENTVTAFFKVNKGEASVNDLTQRDLKLAENGRPITNFTLAADQKRTEQVVEIVFAVDITGTMVELIETAKLRIKEFIKTSGDQGYHARICISTFGDYTVKKCTRFFDNTSKAQVSQLNTELARLSAYRGVGADPGWPDLDENPMRAVIDAADAPWSQDSQRFVILMTDWGFLYLPNREGDKGNPGADPKYYARNQVPRMSEVTAAIKKSGMKVFAVTRTQHVHKGQNLVWDGYNTPFQGEPSIVASSNGEYFDFDKVLSKQISFDSILQRVLNRVDTTYKLTYVVEKNPGLDPSLPAEKRDLRISVDPSRGVVSKPTLQSSMPTGRPQYKQAWKISDDAIASDSLQVAVDGRPLSRSEYSVNQGEVRFTAIPKPGAKIRLSFLLDSIEKNFRIEPIAFNGSLDLRNTKVYLNGKEARAEDLIFAQDLTGNATLTVADSALASNDPYDIRHNQGLTVRVITK